jgi:hypothetical protein
MTPAQLGYPAPRPTKSRPIRSQRRPRAVITRAKQTQFHRPLFRAKRFLANALRQKRANRPGSETNPIKPNWRSHPERNGVESNGPSRYPDPASCPERSASGVEWGSRTDLRSPPERNGAESNGPPRHPDPASGPEHSVSRIERKDTPFLQSEIRKPQSAIGPPSTHPPPIVFWWFSSRRSRMLVPQNQINITSSKRRQK